MKKPQTGTPCPSCAAVKTVCLDTKPVTYLGLPATYRRRKCVKCDHRFATYEVQLEQINRAVESAITGAFKGIDQKSNDKRYHS